MKDTNYGSEDVISSEFLRQLRAVFQTHPLVVAHYLLTDEAIQVYVTDRLQPDVLGMKQTSPVDHVLQASTIDNDTLTAIRVRFAHAWRMLHLDLGRARSNSDVAAAFDAFGERWRDERDHVHECRKCNGTGLIDDVACDVCGGDGMLTG